MFYSKIRDGLGFLISSIKSSIRNPGVTMDQTDCGPTCQVSDSLLFSQMRNIVKLRFIKATMEMLTLFSAASAKHPWIVYKWSKMLLLISLPKGLT